MSAPSTVAPAAAPAAAPPATGGSAAGELPFRGGHVVVHEVGGEVASEVGGRAGERAVAYLHGMVGNPGVHPFLAALAGGGRRGGEETPASAGGRRVIAPSLPGFSGSPPCEDLRSIYDWVVATSEIVDLAGAAGLPMVASSVGAMLALELAAVRPEAFSQLVLIAPLGLWDPEHPVADAFGTTLRQQRSMLTVDPARTAAFFDDDPTRPADELVELNVSRYLARTAAASLVWPIPEFGLATRLHRVACPVTLIWGAADQVIDPVYAERFASALPRVEGTHVVEGAGHLAEWDQPEAVAALVQAALAG
jgi:pimeloyl-ACP methyl ester carboxylesterase